MAQHCAPEEVSGAVLATELAEDICGAGHRVTFLTSTPSYPEGRPKPGYSNKPFQRETRNGVDVVRVWSYISPLDSILRRLANYATFSVAAFLGGLLLKRPDVIFCYSPPLPLGLAAMALACLWRVPWVLRVEDMYPDAAVAAGVLRQGVALRVLRRVEQRLYRDANHVSVIGESFREKLLAKGVPGGKVSVTPVWADPDAIVPSDRVTSVKSEFGINGHFVVLYAGNMGRSSCLEDVVDAATELRNEINVVWLLVGEGPKKADLESTVRQRGLTNVLFHPYVPREQYADLLFAADAGVVTLNDGFAGNSLPSKVFNTMASGRPVLAVAPDACELTMLVRSCACGCSVKPGHPEELARAVAMLSTNADARLLMGTNARIALASRFSRAHCTALILGEITEVACPRA